MVENLQALLDGGYILIVFILGQYILDYLIVCKICKTPTLSDKKVEAITKMLSKKLTFKLLH